MGRGRDFNEGGISSQYRERHLAIPYNGGSAATVILQTPPGFVVRTEARQAAWDHGFRLERGIIGGWIGYGSTTAPGEVWIAASGDHGPWFLSVTHPGVAFELGPQTAPPGTGRAAWVWGTLRELHEALDRTYRLAVSLPDVPLDAFESQTKYLPRATEAERLVVQRIGQDIFRDALLAYWGGACPLTGITEPALLRASHIVAWADCDSDAHRLDVHNGLLLSALWDAAFDRGLMSFADDGEVLVRPDLSQPAREALALNVARSIPNLTDAHRANLVRHRMTHGFSN
jgi:hypothetical protein